MGAGMALVDSAAVDARGVAPAGRTGAPAPPAPAPRDETPVHRFAGRRAGLSRRVRRRGRERRPETRHGHDARIVAGLRDRYGA